MLLVRPRLGLVRRFVLGPRPITIGRSPTCDIVLSDPTVSSLHARIDRRPSGVHVVYDCRSRNGTFVNQARRDEHELDLGDRIQIGGASLSYLREDGDVTEAPHRVGFESRTIATLVDDDTSTIKVAPESFEIDFAESVERTAILERVTEAVFERQLVALYRAGKVLTPIGDRTSIESRFLKLVRELLCVSRAALLRVASDRVEIVASEMDDLAVPFAQEGPEAHLVEASRRVSRSLLYERPASRRVGPRSAMLVPLAVEGEAGLVAYVDAWDPLPVMCPDDLRLLGILSRHASTCIMNQRLSTSLLESNEDLERRVAERARELEESHRHVRFLAGVVTHAALGIFTLDESLKVTSWNAGAESILGFPADEAVGRAFTDLAVSREEGDRFASVLSRVRADGAVDAAELVLRRRDLLPVDTVAALALVRGPGSGAAQISAIIRDVTHQRRLEAQLIQSAKLAAVGTLAAGIAHEFNNLLAVIMGNSELAQQSSDLPKEAETYITTVIDAANRARDVVRHLLTFARRSDVKREPVDLVDLLEATLRLVANDLSRAGVRVRRSLTAIPPVQGDPGRLSLVILNLVKNARDALVAKGGGDLHIVLSARVTDGPRAVLELRDTGTGMPPEVRRRLFEPFFTTKPPGQGTGLGLSTSYGIVTDHGGTIEVESQPGAGSTFRVVLPLEKAAIDELPSLDMGGEEARGFLPAASAPLHVLVCDDDPPVRATLLAMVKQLSHHGTAVASATEALKALESARFDLVLADHGMAGMDGITLRAEILRRLPAQRVVIITGNAYVDELAAKSGLGPEAFLRKPFTFRQITELLENATARA